MKECTKLAMEAAEEGSSQVPARMRDITYYSWHNPPPSRPIVTTLPTRTQRAGYINKLEQIKNLTEAGTKLKEWREQMYHNGTRRKDLEDDLEVHPASRHHYDEFDAHEDSITMERVLAAKAKQKLREEAKNNAVKETVETVKENPQNSKETPKAE